MACDIFVKNHGSILIFTPASAPGMEWINEHLPACALRWAGGVVVEPRYAQPIIDGAEADGLLVEA